MEWLVLFLISGFMIMMGIAGLITGPNEREIRNEHEERLVSSKSLDECFIFALPVTPSVTTPYTVRRGVKTNEEKFYMVGVKWDEKKLFFGGVSDPFEIGFAQIVEVGLVRDDQSVTKTNRGAQLAGAAIGAVALGGVGAIIGGLSGSSRNKTKIRSIDIKIETEHPSVLVFKASFLKSSSKSGDKPDGMIAKQGISEAERWYSILQRAMKQGPSAAPHDDTDNLPGSSTETRLEKLWKLHENGALTKDEYAQQKRKLLSDA